MLMKEGPHVHQARRRRSGCTFKVGETLDIQQQPQHIISIGYQRISPCVQI